MKKVQGVSLAFSSKFYSKFIKNVQGVSLAFYSKFIHEKNARGKPSILVKTNQKYEKSAFYSKFILKKWKNVQEVNLAI